MNLKNSKKIIVGKICSPYGILGWIKLFSFTEKIKKIFKYKPLLYFYKKKIKTLKIKLWKKYKNFFLVKIKNINTRTKAFLLKNKKIFIYSKQLKKKKNEYYWYEIIDLKVFNTEKIFLGKVIDIIRTPTNDILKINFISSKKEKKIEKLIPFVEKKIITKISLKKKNIIINTKGLIF
ncbi:MAG: 16S rRNA processing protein RimM [Buchnera aphidicola (Periphyllus aceris)]|nr:16S rRNA processing protein RimM [Buchnera aphidicola (Periphyllus aceris)]